TPVGLNVAGILVRGDAVVEDDVGAGNPPDRPVLVVDRRAPPGVGASEVGGPFAHVGREADALGIDELGAFDGVFGAHAEAGVHQVGQRTGVTRVAGNEIHERRVLLGVAHVVIFVATGRKVRPLVMR